MSSMSDFYVRSKGLEAITKDWKDDHNCLQKNVWPLEDILLEYVKCAALAIELFHDLRQRENASDLPFSLGDVIDWMENLVHTGHAMLWCADKIQYKYSIQGIRDLNDSIKSLTAIVNEDRFATDAALSGLLDDKT